LAPETGVPVTAGSMALTESVARQLARSGYGVAPCPGAGNDDPVGRMRGWPVSIEEPSLLDAPVGLRPVQVRDARVWRDSRVRNATNEHARDARGVTQDGDAG